MILTYRDSTEMCCLLLLQSEWEKLQTEKRGFHTTCGKMFCCTFFHVYLCGAKTNNNQKCKDYGKERKEMFAHWSHYIGILDDQSHHHEYCE